MRKWAVLVTLVLVISGRAVAAEDFFQKGSDAFQKGQYDEAIRYYTLHLSSNPNDADAYTYRASAYKGKGQYDLELIRK